jgi:hypothetical protein
MCDFFVRSKRRQLGHNGFLRNGLFHMMKVELEGGVDQTKKGVVVFVRC